MRLVIRWRAMRITLTGDGIQRGLKVMSGSSRVACIEVESVLIQKGNRSREHGSRTFGVSRKHHIRIPGIGLRRANQDGVIGMSLDMLLQVLWALEGLAAKVTLVWLEGHMDTNMRGDMVSLDGGRTTATPLAGQVEVVGALAANMAFTDVFLHLLVYNYFKRVKKETHVERFRCRRLLSTTLPQTRQLLTGSCSGSSTSRVITLVHGSRSTHGRGRRRRRSGDRRRRRRGRDSGLLLLLLSGHDMRLLMLRLMLLLWLLLLVIWGQMSRSVGGSSSHGGHGSVLVKFRHCQDQKVFLSVSWEQRNQPRQGEEGGKGE